MISDLYWQMFINDGSVYSYIKYSESIQKEGKCDNDTGSVYCGCVGNSGTADR